MVLVVDAQINVTAALLVKQMEPSSWSLVSEAGRGLFLQRTSLVWKALWSQGHHEQECWAWLCCGSVQKEKHAPGWHSELPHALGLLLGKTSMWMLRLSSSSAWWWDSQELCFSSQHCHIWSGGAHCKQGIEHKCTLELCLARDNAAADTLWVASVETELCSSQNHS